MTHPLIAGLREEIEDDVLYEFSRDRLSNAQASNAILAIVEKRLGKVLAAADAVCRAVRAQADDGYALEPPVLVALKAWVAVGEAGE